MADWIEATLQAPAPKGVLQAPDWVLEGVPRPAVNASVSASGEAGATWRLAADVEAVAGRGALARLVAARRVACELERWVLAEGLAQPPAWTRAWGVAHGVARAGVGVAVAYVGFFGWWIGIAAGVPGSAFLTAAVFLVFDRGTTVILAAVAVVAFLGNLFPLVGLPVYPVLPLHEPLVNAVVFALAATGIVAGPRRVTGRRARVVRLRSGGEAAVA